MKRFKYNTKEVFKVNNYELYTLCEDKADYVENMIESCSYFVLDKDETLVELVDSYVDFYDIEVFHSKYDAHKYDYEKERSEWEYYQQCKVDEQIELRRLGNE